MDGRKDFLFLGTVKRNKNGPVRKKLSRYTRSHSEKTSPNLIEDVPLYDEDAFAPLTVHKFRHSKSFNDLTTDHDFANTITLGMCDDVCTVDGSICVGLCRHLYK